MPTHLTGFAVSLAGGRESGKILDDGFRNRQFDTA